MEILVLNVVNGFSYANPSQCSLMKPLKALENLTFLTPVVRTRTQFSKLRLNIFIGYFIFAKSENFL